MNAEAAGSDSIAKVLDGKRNELASVDINISNPKTSVDFGLKYYSNAQNSAKAQSMSIYERYMESSSRKRMSLEEYLDGTPFSDKNPSSPIYEGQVRIIPADQLELARELLRRRYLKEAYNRPEEALRYKDTLDHLDCVLKDGKGIESVKLTKDESEVLARAAQAEKVDAKMLKQFGVSAEDAIKCEYIVKQSLKAGANAALISLVLKLSPEIVKAISFLIKNGYIEKGTLKNLGSAAISGASKGFIRGAVAAGLTTACKSGMLGSAMKGTSPNAISALVVLVMGTLDDAIDVALEKKQPDELAINLIKNVVVMYSAMYFGALGQAALWMAPVAGYVLGSIIGSIVGGLANKIGGSIFLSLCVESGFTMFGLVKQDYQLPRQALEYIGADLCNFEKCTYEESHFDTCEIETTSFEETSFDRCIIEPLRRGVIGVRMIGYC